ncbi:MAG TPA: Gfo/Idh/MocA family oxidoreductase, partial [Lacipirellulaceae bacterium]|nr:Gfo/Idh/MocA family oxidoreductase [Lacipirellulaceae bacterium]
RAVHAGADETLRVGLVGCGNRGKGAALDALAADPQARLVAVADVFADAAQRATEDLQHDETLGPRAAVDPERVFVGFDAYKQLIDSGVDVVILATPPHFRPAHLSYAVAAGKHCFVEKPVAVDAPGVREVMAACEEARRRKLSIVSGLCWRYELGMRECVRQVVEERAIGNVVAIETRYLANLLWHRGDDPQWSPMEKQVRNWLYHTWLSGDHILEQAVHSIDKAAWILGDVAPLKAVALGGRQQRTDPKYGDVYDHFSVFYEFPEGVRVSFSCRQQDRCAAEVEDRILGAEGVMELVAHKRYDRAGNEAWRYRGPKPSMYRVEHQEMFAGIRAGRPIDNGHYMCHSTLLALMGRQAAYTGAMVTWDQCLNGEERLGPTEYQWGDAPEAIVPVPGRSTLA